VAAIDLQAVTRRFGDLVAVDAVTFDVEVGEIVGLLGHNGAGKTTLIRVINGLLDPDAGSVRVGGLDPIVDGHQVRRTTGVLTEYPALDEFLTTRENLEVYAAINAVPRRAAGQRIEELLHELGLWEKRDEPARELSAGLKQRVAIARALVHDPQILLLDEPTTNMDPVAARSVRHLIVDSVRRRGRTVLLSTHNLVEAEELCDRIGIVRNGRLLLMGSPSELRHRLGGIHGVVIGVATNTAATARASLEGLVAHRNGEGAHHADTKDAGEALRLRVLDTDTIEVTGRVRIPELVAGLVAAGIEVHQVRPMAPSLEDLYVALHAEPERTPHGGSIAQPRSGVRP
jgi:ABC-2 type transport system ATP-binding protein